MPIATLSRLLVNAAEGYPEKIALITADGSVSYRELFCRASTMAARLIDVGVCSGDRIAICLPKCVDLSVALFGVLLAGGCYVPIDPNTPTARVRLIIDDAEPKAIICGDREIRRLFEGAGLPLPHRPAEHPRGTRRPVWLCLVTPSMSLSRTFAVSDLEEAVGGLAGSATGPGDANARAYILYTSGSTGRPKGVVHTHESAMAFVEWAAAHVNLGPEDVLSQHATPSFDLTVFDFFCSALAAATLVSVPEWLFGNVIRTARFIADSGITVWYSVPSALLREGGEASLDLLRRSSLRQVIFAGEVLRANALKGLAQRLPQGCSISNWYGPTETNVCTHEDIGLADLEAGGTIPIGRPCPFSAVEVERSASSNSEGELLVASLTLMEGYWKLDELTGRAFVANSEGRLFYRTGDLVTWHDGRLFIRGRTDRLLKIRGFRVQPEEAERVLAGHTDVVETAVVVRKQDGLDGLAAAVVAVDGSREDLIVADLMRLCAEILPSYMIPSPIFLLPALPRGDRGKVDLEAVSRLIPAWVDPSDTGKTGSGTG